MKLFLPKALLAVYAILCSACSYTVIDKPSMSGRLESLPSTVVVGYVANAKPQFYDSVVNGLGDIPGCQVVAELDRDSWPKSSVVLTGSLEIAPRDSFGEKFGRHVIGFGAGRRHVNGNYQLGTVGQEPNLVFNATEFYNGGTGLGGFFDVPGWFIGPIVDGTPFIGYQTDIIGTDTMQKRLGEEVGETIRHWILLKASKS